MGARERRSMRRKQIVLVCQDLRKDSLSTPHGLHPTEYDPNDLYEMVMDCAGFDYMSDPEKHLAVVAFEQGAEIAKESIWYK